METRISTLFGKCISAIALMALACSLPSLAWCTNLWVPFIGNGAEVFTSKQLKKSETPAPIQFDTFGKFTGFAFDKSHNLWAVSIDPDEVVQFTPAQLKKLKENSSPTPAVIITNSSSGGAGRGCNFDPQGNLWIADLGNASLDELSKEQLEAGSADEPFNVVITSADLVEPEFVTFDKLGNVWVTNEDRDKIVAFSASQLSSSGHKSPMVVLSDDGSGTSISSPGEVAFDKKGNLWVPNLGANTVVEFEKADLSGSGNPAPIVKLSSAVFDQPWAAAFDSKGDLIVVNFDNGTISKFAPKQLKKTGAPTPEVTLPTGIDDVSQIIFGPSS
jgi:DNA-binding beta-propeller fold protein YncE